MRPNLLASVLAAALVLPLACVRNPLPEPPSPDLVPVVALPARVAVASATTRRAPLLHPFPPAGRRIDFSSIDERSLVRTWRGLRVLSRQRCPGYDPELYAPVEHPERLPARVGSGWRDPLTCSWYPGRSAADVVAARLVSPAVAHDAGLCSAEPAVRAAFAWDPENTVYLPATVAALRRYLADVGGSQWLPSSNRCWYVQAQLRVRRRYRLAVTLEESRAFDAVLRDCPLSRLAPYCGPYGGDVMSAR